MRTVLLTALLLTGATAYAQTDLAMSPAPRAGGAAPAGSDAPPTTILALAAPTPAPLPTVAGLAAPLPSGATAQPLRTNDGVTTTRWILGIAGAILGVIVAVQAAQK